MKRFRLRIDRIPAVSTTLLNVSRGKCRHDRARALTPSGLSSLTIRRWLGLSPRVRSPVSQTTGGPITKTGSMLARRLLVESAWHYAREPRIAATLQYRQDGQPEHILQIGDRCHSASIGSTPGCAPAASRTT